MCFHKISVLNKHFNLTQKSDLTKVTSQILQMIWPMESIKNQIYIFEKSQKSNLHPWKIPKIKFAALEILKN